MRFSDLVVADGTVDPQPFEKCTVEEKHTTHFESERLSKQYWHNFLMRERKINSYFMKMFAYASILNPKVRQETGRF